MINAVRRLGGGFLHPSRRLAEIRINAGLAQPRLNLQLLENIETIRAIRAIRS
jgi:hypothetical protein